MVAFGKTECQRRSRRWPSASNRTVVHVDVARNRILAWRQDPQGRDLLAVYDIHGKLLWQRLLDVRGATLDLEGERVLALGTDASIRVLNASTGQLISMWRVERAALPLVARWDPSGPRVLVSTNLGSVYLYEASTGQIIDCVRGHAGDVLGVALSKDGAVLVTAGAHGEARRWQFEIPDGLPGLHRVGRSGLALSPDGTRVAIASASGELTICDENARVLKRSRIGKGEQFVSFCKDAKSVLVAGRNGLCLRWDTSSDEGPREIPTPPVVRARGCYHECKDLGSGTVLFHRGDKRAVVGDRSGRGRFLLPSSMIRLSAAALSSIDVAEGNEIVVGAWDKAVRILDQKGRVLWEKAALGDVPNTVRFVDQGRLVVASVGLYANVWDRESGARESFGPHASKVTDLIMVAGSDGDRVVTGTMRGRINVFDRRSRKLVLSIKAHDRAVLRLGVTRSNRIVSSGADGHVRWWALDRASVLKLLDRVGIPRFSAAERASYEKLLGQR